MRFIDTNLFIRYFTRDDEEKAEAVLKLLKRVEKNEERIITSPLVIFELVFTLGSYYKVPRREIKEIMQPVFNLRGLRLDYRDVFEAALELYSQSNLSFTDAFNACFMNKREIEEIYSFDRDFDQLEGIKRVVP
jgi:predicted nucleic acid-binding protein